MVSEWFLFDRAVHVATQCASLATNQKRRPDDGVALYGRGESGPTVWAPSDLSPSSARGAPLGLPRAPSRIALNFLAAFGAAFKLGQLPLPGCDVIGLRQPPKDAA